MSPTRSEVLAQLAALVVLVLPKWAVLGNDPLASLIIADLRDARQHLRLFASLFATAGDLPHFEAGCSSGSIESEINIQSDSAEE